MRAARQQGSGLFEDEAVVRLARLHLATGDVATAAKLLDDAAPRLAQARNPMLFSQYGLVQALRAQAENRPVEALAPDVLDRLGAMAGPAAHPLVQVRYAKARYAAALLLSQRPEALDQVLRQQRVALDAGLREWAIDAVISRACDLAAESEISVAATDELAEARAEAEAYGMAPLVIKADRWLGLQTRPAEETELEWPRGGAGIPDGTSPAP